MTNKTASKARSRNTTVAVSPEVADKLDRFCRANNMTKKDFVSESLDYFLKEGINPKVHESPQAEIKKITKRIDQFFAFFKKQEQEFIKPLMLEIVQNGNYQTEKFDTVLHNHNVISSQIKTVDEGVKTKSSAENMDNKFSNLDTKITTSNKQIRRAIETIGEHLDPKNKKGLLDNLNNIFR